MCVCIHILHVEFHIALHRVLLTSRAGWRDWLQIMVKLKVILIVCRQIPRVKRSIAELLALSMSTADTHTHFFFHSIPHVFSLMSTVTFALRVYDGACMCAYGWAQRESVASWLIGLTRLVSACGWGPIKRECWSIPDGLTAVVCVAKKSYPATLTSASLYTHS